MIIELKKKIAQTFRVSTRNVKGQVSVHELRFTAPDFILEMDNHVADAALKRFPHSLFLSGIVEKFEAGRFVVNGVSNANSLSLKELETIAKIEKLATSFESTLYGKLSTAKQKKKSSTYTPVLSTSVPIMAKYLAEKQLLGADNISVSLDDVPSKIITVVTELSGKETEYVIFDRDADVTIEKDNYEAPKDLAEEVKKEEELKAKAKAKKESNA